jgi:hypothetical protein
LARAANALEEEEEEIVGGVVVVGVATMGAEGGGMAGRGSRGELSGGRSGALSPPALLSLGLRLAAAAGTAGRVGRAPRVDDAPPRGAAARARRFMGLCFEGGTDSKAMGARVPLAVTRSRRERRARWGKEDISDGKALVETVAVCVCVLFSR